MGHQLYNQPELTSHLNNVDSDATIVENGVLSSDYYASDVSPEKDLKNPIVQNLSSILQNDALSSSTNYLSLKSTKQLENSPNVSERSGNTIKASNNDQSTKDDCDQFLIKVG